MTLTARHITALIVLPLVATAVVGVVVAVTSGIPPVGFIVIVCVLSLLVTLVLGVPAYLMTKAWHLKSAAAFAAVGAIVGAVPAAGLAVAFPESLDFAVSAICAGAVAGLVLKRLVNVGL